MSDIQWTIPLSTRKHLTRAPRDRAVVVLLRHSVRDSLPAGDAGHTLPITEVGHRLARELGERLRGQLRTLRSSPLLRCVQTAEALVEGAQAALPVIPDRHLGDPGVFVIDALRAPANWEALGHEGVMEHLVRGPLALPGMARPDEAARFLVLHMLAVAAGQPGIHIFVTHDSLVTATAARLLGQALGADDWPWYLEGAFFWQEGAGVHVAYRERKAVRAGPLCELNADDVIELSRREIGATIGLDTGARFFLAGGAFKSLLTGLPPRDLDLWAPSERDRALLVDALRTRGARLLSSRPLADAFSIADRVVEVPHAVQPSTLSERLSHFDIALSAIGVEHRPGGQWSAIIHPLARESVRRREVLLLKPLVNWRYALATLERMRRYSRELKFALQPEEEAEVWRVFDAQPNGEQLGMIARCRRVAISGSEVIDEAVARSR